MADEFQTGICSGNWWNNSARNALMNVVSLPCSTAINHDMGSFGWPTEMVEVKARSSCEESVSVSGSSIVLQDAPKPQGSDSVCGGGRSVLMDSTLQMMGYGLSSSTNMDWSQQALLSRSSTGRTESNFHSMLQEDLSSRQNFRLEPRVESVHQTNQGFSSIDQHHSSSSCESTVTCQGLPASFPLDSTSSVSYGYPSTLLQGLLDQSNLQTHQQSPYENRPMNYPPNYGMITNDLSPSWPRFPQLLKTSSPPKQQQIASHQLHFSNNAPYWNASAATPNNNIRSTFYPSSQAQLLTPTFEGKPNCSSNLSLKPKAEEVRDSSSVVKKSSSEPATKRPRVDTPSPLPTFKVRKEKLGDRITALQQLVSPFGKTDTASVLYEAIEYIKFLHEQVSALSAPYMKNGAVIQQQQQQSTDKSKDGEGPQQDLRSRGLCLVPVSSTFPVTNETTADFWTPTFGGTYR